MIGPDHLDLRFGLLRCFFKRRQKGRAHGGPSHSPPVCIGPGHEIPPKSPKCNSSATCLSVWRKEERKSVQRGVCRVNELGDRNIEKSRADFRREAQQNSKNKTVPRPWLQHKEAAKLSAQQLDRVASIR